MTINAVELTH